MLTCFPSSLLVRSTSIFTPSLSKLHRLHFLSTDVNIASKDPQTMKLHTIEENCGT